MCHVAADSLAHDPAETEMFSAVCFRSTVCKIYYVGDRCNPSGFTCAGSISVEDAPTFGKRKLNAQLKNQRCQLQHQEENQRDDTYGIKNLRYILTQMHCPLSRWHFGDYRRIATLWLLVFLLPAIIASCATPRVRGDVAKRLAAAEDIPNVSISFDPVAELPPCARWMEFRTTGRPDLNNIKTLNSGATYILNRQDSYDYTEYWVKLEPTQGIEGRWQRAAFEMPWPKPKPAIDDTTYIDAREVWDEETLAEMSKNIEKLLPLLKKAQQTLRTMHPWRVQPYDCEQVTMNDLEFYTTHRAVCRISEPRVSLLVRDGIVYDEPATPSGQAGVLMMDGEVLKLAYYLDIMESMTHSWVDNWKEYLPLLGRLVQNPPANGSTQCN